MVPPLLLSIVAFAGGAGIGAAGRAEQNGERRTGSRCWRCRRRCGRGNESLPPFLFDDGQSCRRCWRRRMSVEPPSLVIEVMPDVLALKMANAFVGDIADDPGGVGRIAELQRRAGTDRGAAGIGIGAGQHHEPLPVNELSSTVSLPAPPLPSEMAPAMVSVDAVGVDRAAKGGVVDPEIVVEGQIAQTVSLKLPVGQRHRSRADRCCWSPAGCQNR